MNVVCVRKESLSARVNEMMKDTVSDFEIEHMWEHYW